MGWSVDANKNWRIGFLLEPASCLHNVSPVGVFWLGEERPGWTAWGTGYGVKVV